MIREIKVPVTEPVISQNANIVYAQKTFWCGGATKALHLSLLYRRQFFPFDPVKDPDPLLIWLCGGGFSESDWNVMNPELVYFAKHGYAVACVEYNFGYRCRWPEPLQNVKEAIRFLRANAETYHYNADRIVIMGESAGAYLACACGVTNGEEAYEDGGYRSQNSSVQGVIAYYPPLNMTSLFDPAGILPNDIKDYIRPVDHIPQDMPPVVLMQGEKDALVRPEDTRAFYEALRDAGKTADLYMVEGADHCQYDFFQPYIKEIVLEHLGKMFS